MKPIRTKYILIARPTNPELLTEELNFPYEFFNNHIEY